MATKPFIAEKGFMTQVLGSVATLAIAAPIVDGSRSETGLTDAGRIGFYFDRTTSNEKVGVVVKGTEILSVGYVSGNATVRVIGDLDPIGETVAGNYNTIIGAGADHGSPLTAIYCTLVGAESYAESGVQDTIVMGDYAQAWSSQQVVLGSGAVAQSTAAGGILIGAAVTLPAGSAGTVLIGYGASCGTGVGNAVAIGRTASVGAVRAIAIGYQTEATGSDSIAIGSNNGAAATGSIAIGGDTYVDAVATGGVCIGDEAGVYARRSLALGASSGVGVDDDYSIALGYYAGTTAAHQLVLGSVAGYIDDIAVGAGDTDDTGTSGLVTTIRASNRSAGSGTARGLRLRSGAGSSGASNGSVYLNVGGTDVVTVSRASATGGTVSIAQGTITNPSVMLSGTATWNDAADTFTAWKLDVTDTNSAAASLLLDLQVGSSSKLNVAKSGRVTSAGGYHFDQTYGSWGNTAGAASYSRAQLSVTAADEYDGFTLDACRLNFQGTTKHLGTIIARGDYHTFNGSAGSLVDRLIGWSLEIGTSNSNAAVTEVYGFDFVIGDNDGIPMPYVTGGKMDCWSSATDTATATSAIGLDIYYVEAYDSGSGIATGSVYGIRIGANGLYQSCVTGDLYGIYIAAGTNDDPNGANYSLYAAGAVYADTLELSASTTARAGLNIAPGTAPTTPDNGDVWTTGSSMFVQIGGASYDLLTGIGELGTSTTVSSSTTIVNRKTAFTGSTASQTLTMPVGTSRSEYCITNDATVSVSIAPGVGQTIEGLATLLMLPGDSAYFALVGTDWKIIA